MEDPVKRIFFLEVTGPCHIDADLRLISTEGCPDFSSALAEGDGRTPAFSHRQMGPAKYAADHLKWESSSVGKFRAFPKRTFRRCNMIPQDGD
jgi:hypothetical protein